MEKLNVKILQFANEEKHLFTQELLTLQDFQKRTQM